MFGLDGGRRMFDRETSKPKRVSETLGRLVAYFKPYWPVLLLTAVLIVGNTWTQVSGDYFEGVSISRLVVNPGNANMLYAAVLRGRGGARRTTPPVHSKFGIWKSTDGGVNWTLLKEAKSESNGATDLEMDPQNPSILYSSFWGDAIYKSTDAGNSWSPIMNFGFTGANFAAALTRFSIAISHPSAGGDGTLYAGFDWVDAGGYHPSRAFKSTNGGTSWALLPDGSGGRS